MKKLLVLLALSLFVGCDSPLNKRISPLEELKLIYDVENYELLDSVSKGDFCTCKHLLNDVTKDLKYLRKNSIENRIEIKDKILDSVKYQKQYDYIKNDMLYLYRLEIKHKEYGTSSSYYYIDSIYFYPLNGEQYKFNFNYTFDSIKWYDNEYDSPTWSMCYKRYL